MITINLYNWYIPILIGVMSLICCLKFGKSKGSFDPISPIIGLGIIAAGISFIIGWILRGCI